jgi:hypothetical protein
MKLLLYILPCEYFITFLRDFPENFEQAVPIQILP